jgi:hypothetical protein
MGKAGLPACEMSLIVGAIRGCLKSLIASLIVGKSPCLVRFHGRETRPERIR